MRSWRDRWPSTPTRASAARRRCARPSGSSREPGSAGGGVARPDPCERASPRTPRVQAGGRGGCMDALDLLEQQHRDTLALIDRVANEPRPGKRTALVIALVRAIEAHSRAEERCFYPALRERIGDDDRLYEAFEDHALMRLLAGNLLRTRATDVRFSARLKLVQDIFLRHATVEEDWGFPKAKRHFTDENLDVIGADVARAHEMLMHTELKSHVQLRPRRSLAGHRSQGAHRVSKRAQLSRCGRVGA